MSIESSIPIIISLLQEAGDMTIPYFEQNVTNRGNKTIEIKADHSPVTEADRNTELWLRDQLTKEFPDFGIIGEEFDTVGSDSEYSWIIDPIDGTRSFIAGVPLYTTLLGLIHTKTRTPVAGFIYAPITEELVYAVASKGCMFMCGNRKQKSKVVPCNDITQATVLSYDLQKLYRRKPSLLPFLHKANNVRTWADGYAYLMLATGRAHAVIDPNMHIWDIAPVYQVIVEAGGFVHSWDSKDIDWKSNDIDIIACSSPSLLALIQENM